MGGRLSWLLAVLLITTGCLGSDPPGMSQETIQPEPAGPSFVGPVNVSTTQPAAEPVIAAGPNGTLYYQGIGSLGNTFGTIATGVAPQMVNSLWRSTDHGQTWEPLELPAPATNGSGDGFVAVAPDGTVYHANAFGPGVAFVATPAGPPAFVDTPGHLQIHRSEDQGESWTALAVPQVPDDLHRMWLVPEEGGDLHVTVAGNSPDPSTPRPLWYLRSEDAGETWREPVVVHETRSIGSDLAVGPDGDLYTVIWTPGAESDLQLMRSTDDGATWEALPIPLDVPRGAYASVWSSLEAGPDGALTFLWAHDDGEGAQVVVSASTDKGEAWTDPRAVSPAPGPQLLPWSSMSDQGELEVMFLQAEPNASGARVWYPTYARLDDATRNVTASTVTRLTEAPVHRGELCVGGYCSGEGGTRGFLEYTWITHDPEGQAHLAFGTVTDRYVHAVPLYAGET